jgi:murein DD-endopeptidase MepM/ murein hydrolase activator NlpD
MQTNKLLLIFLIILSPLTVQAFTIGEEFINIKGGLLIKEVSENEYKKGFKLNNVNLLTYSKGQKFFLIYGIPYNSNVGSNIIKITSNPNLIDKTINFKIKNKDFKTQFITVSKKYTTPSKINLLRIKKEKKFLVSSKNKWIDINPDLKFILPVNGTETGVFGTRRFYNKKEGKAHNGLDIAAKKGTTIVAPSSGSVLLTGNYFYNGKFVFLDHGRGLKSIFIHMNKINVSKGQIIQKGEKIGEVGSTGKSTGAHMHWSLILNETYINPKVFLEIKN